MENFAAAEYKPSLWQHRAAVPMASGGKGQKCLWRARRLPWGLNCKKNRARPLAQMPSVCTAAYFTKALQGRLRLCGAFLPYFGRQSMTYLLQNLDTAVLSNFTGRGLY